jgi:hypothetical protein
LEFNFRWFKREKFGSKRAAFRILSAPFGCHLASSGRAWAAVFTPKTNKKPHFHPKNKHFSSPPAKGEYGFSREGVYWL